MRSEADKAQVWRGQRVTSRKLNSRAEVSAADALSVSAFIDVLLQLGLCPFWVWSMLSIRSMKVGVTKKSTILFIMYEQKNVSMHRSKAFEAWQQRVQMQYSILS